MPMSANRSIGARRTHETWVMDCSNNYDIDASRPGPAYGEKGRILSSQGQCGAAQTLHAYTAWKDNRQR
jgi:hypothetical protein